MSKVEIKKAGNCFTVELLTSTELTMTITSNSELKTTIFEKIVSYETLDAEMKYLFQNIKQLFDALTTLITNDGKQDFLMESDGRVHFLLEIKLFEKIVRKKLTFELEKQLTCEQEVHVLRANINSARTQIAELKVQITKLAEENTQLKVKFSELQQLVFARLNYRKEQYKSLKSKLQKPQQQKIPQNSKSENLQTQVVEQQISEQFLKVAPLKVEIDDRCLHYNKFIITANKITSQIEDYYQIYNKDPLPKRGIYSLKVKMVGQNHLSIGILGKSALNNQYSFQNNKAVCFYSYFYGNFRGIYFRSKYQPLNWIMQVGEVIHFQIDMNTKELKIGSPGRKSTEVINFKSLYEEEPVYFFIEMYQKDNIIEFL